VSLEALRGSVPPLRSPTKICHNNNNNSNNNNNNNNNIFKERLEKEFEYKMH
jgi:hypothetical protein